MATIFIRDLLLRTEVGFNEHELGKKQDLLLNLTIHYELEGEQVSDDPRKALDYRSLCKTIVDMVEESRYNLLEAIANRVVEFLMSIPRIQKVEVTVDKPHALRFSRSVALSISDQRIVKS
ncbi:MAG TPA: dihydroneopterin aldolase [Marinilabiliaceae bacterium]|nr:dihydroneopterin aldolase [Marinilabiliaceae bacterium]